MLGLSQKWMQATMEISVEQAKATFAEILAAADRGETVVITRQGRPIAQVTPFTRTGEFKFAIDDPRRAKCGLPTTPQPIGDDMNDPGLSRQVLGLAENG
jgi:prevent-host-death family protein